MDSWYATKEIMLLVESLKKIYYCPLKDNRQVDDSGGDQPYHRVHSLQWSAAERAQGKVVKLKGFPKEHKVKLFRVVLSAYGAAHGLCRYQQLCSGQHPGLTRSVWLALED